MMRRTDIDAEHRAARRRRGQAGFTLMETLVALAVFAIAVVGLVAIEARGIESQRAARDIREAERIAQEAMAELESRGFIELLARDFAGTLNPTLPYSDQGVPIADRLRDQHRPPADIPDTDFVAGSVRSKYVVFREVSFATNPAAVAPPPAPIIPGEVPLVGALVLDVLVMWIDDSNPAYPPPANITVTDLFPAMVDPTSVADYRPWVGSVRLRRIRANDAVLLPAP